MKLLKIFTHNSSSSMRFLFVSSILIFVIGISWTCKDDVNDAGSSTIVFPDSNISYSKQVQPLFDRGCGTQSTGCHSIETFDLRGYSLDSYENATNRVGIIVRFVPDASLLIGTIEGRTPPKMPPFPGAPLNNNQTKGMRQWVTEGARGDN